MHIYLVVCAEQEVADPSTIALVSILLYRKPEDGEGMRSWGSSVRTS